MAKTEKRRARFRIQRRLGVELPGLGKPGALERRPYPPGQHGNKRKKFSNYALQLEEKQKVMFHYGLREKQLRRFIRDAQRGDASKSWINQLAGRLELRLDNVVFRLGLAPSIMSARQLVAHGHVLVNDKKVRVSSVVLRVGDKIALKEASYNHQVVLKAKESPRMEMPDYLAKADTSGKAIGTIKSVPGLEYIPFQFSSNLFTEYYSIRSV
ncbi:MAG: 30S ribosomal protein S4 [Bdellovibrionales bacterium]|nr:30S ribosomal protein S4 [Bdellovibrionales bacterium]